MKALLLERGPVARRAILLALVAGVPAIFLRSQNDPFNVPKLAFLIMGVAVVAAIRVSEMIQGAPTDGLKRLWVPAVAIIAPLTIAWVASPYKGWALFGQYGRFQGLIPYVILVLFGVLIADAFAGRTLPLAWAFVIGGALMGAYAVAQRFEIDPFEWVVGGVASPGVALATTGNPNFTGGFLGVVLPVSVALLFIDDRRRILGAIALALVVGGWFVADSQGGWGAGVAGTGLVLGLFLTPRWRYARYLGWAAVVLAVVVALGSVVWALNDPGNGVTSNTVLWRGRWWVAAARMAGESPVFGTGPNTFAIEGVQHRVVGDAVDLNYNFADDPHSVFLSFLANGGAIGFLGYSVLVVWVVRRGARLDGTQRLAATWFAALAAYFVQAIVSIDELSLRLALWVSLGGLVASTLSQEELGTRPAPSRRRRKKLKREPLEAWPAVAVLGLAALFASWWSLKLMIADSSVQRGNALFQSGGDPEEASREFDNALGFRDDYEYRQMYGYELGQVALALQAEGREYLGRSDEVFRFLDDFPSISGFVTQGRILNAWTAVDPSAADRAIDIYTRAREADPLNPMIAVEMSDVLNNIGRYEQATAELEDTRATGETYGDWWGALAISRVLLGDTAGAEEAIERAFALVPEEQRALKAQELINETAPKKDS